MGKVDTSLLLVFGKANMLDAAMALWACLNTEAPAVWEAELQANRIHQLLLLCE